jgi:hypothetical protein
MSRLETLPDEILMIIFRYSGDVYSLFRSFFGLNQRLNQILIDKRLHLFTDFLQIHIRDINFDYYYNSTVFKTVSRQLLSMNTTVNEQQLRQCFQSLITFHIREQYIQMADQVEIKILNLKSIRDHLSNEQILNVDKDLKKAFEDLRKPVKDLQKKFTIERIELLVHRKGACLEYNDQEQTGFYFAEDFRDIFFTYIDHMRSYTQVLTIRILQTLKTLFISNPHLLKYPCYGGGYNFSIYEYLLYSLYRLEYSYYHNSSNSVDIKGYRALVDLIICVIHCQKKSSDDENWIRKIILMVLDVFSKSKPVKDNQIYIQTTQIEIFKILLDEYMLLEPTTIWDDENSIDRFRHILDGLARTNRFDVLLLVYCYYKPVQKFFNNPNNIQQNVNMLTGSRERRQLFHRFIDGKPCESWLSGQDLIFILLQKKERKLIEKLLKSLSFLIDQVDKVGNNLLLYVCLKVSGCRHRIVEFLIKMKCDTERRNLIGENFSDALQLPRNRNLLKNLMKLRVVKIDDVSGPIRFILNE